MSECVFLSVCACPSRHTGAVAGHLECAALLLACGASPSVCNQDGRTPAHTCQSLPVLLLLAAYGAGMCGRKCLCRGAVGECISW